MPDRNHPSLGPLHRTRSLVADDIVVHLERLIVTGALAAGEALPPERLLAQDLGVSRNALREALTRLSSLGMIERRQGSGNRVSRAIPLASTLAAGLREVEADVRHSAEFRSEIEPRIARLAAQRIDEAQLAALDAMLEDAARETDRKSVV